MSTPNVTPIRRERRAAERAVFSRLDLLPSARVTLVGALSAPSREFATFDVLHRCGDLLIDYTYWAGDVQREAGVHFATVQAFQRRADIYCTPWHLEGYDRVVEIEDSAWIEELRETVLPRFRDHFELHHFLVYIDGEGAFEVIAEDVLLTPDVAV